MGKILVLLVISECCLWLTVPQLGLIAFGIVVAEADRYGSGRHIWDITGGDYVIYNKV